MFDTRGKIEILILCIVIIVGTIISVDAIKSEGIRIGDGKYVGEVNENGEPNGYGKMTYNFGEIYEGNWIAGIKDGYGKYEYLDGSIYEGMWKNNEMYGDGKLIKINGEMQEGFFKNNKLRDGTIIKYYESPLKYNNKYSQRVINYQVVESNIHEVFNYKQLLNIIGSNIDGDRISIIVKADDVATVFIKKYKNEYYNLLDDIDNVLFENFKIIANIEYLDYNYDKDDKILCIDMTLRDFLTIKEKEEITQKVSEIVTNQIDEDMTPYQKIKTLHDYLVRSVTYEESGYNSNNSYGALIEGKAVCEGYTEAFALLLNEAEIDNYMVQGDDLNINDNTTHIWNLVYFGTDYYHVDVTWDDMDELDNISYDYFGVNDAEIIKTHNIYRKDIPKSGIVRNIYYYISSMNRDEVYLFYSNATYYGQVNSDGLEHGEGYTIFDNGDEHWGSYKNGFYEGYGTLLLR